MDERIKISSIAQKEFEESIAWYEERGTGLGDRFADVIYEAADAILLNPEACRKSRSPYREFVVDEFPYIIVYEILKKENVINVLHIFHTSRNPKFKFKKK